MKKLIILFAVTIGLTACRKTDVQKIYEIDNRIYIYPTATIVGNNTPRLEASVSQTEIGSDAVMQLRLDKLHFYIRNIKTGVERTIITEKTFVDVYDLDKNSEYSVTIEGFIDNKKSVKSNSIYISTYPSPREKTFPTNSTYFENPFNQQKQVSENLEMGISFLLTLNVPQIATYSLTTFKTGTTEKILEFKLSENKYYQSIGWSDDNKKIFFLTIENNIKNIIYYDIDKKIFINSSFSTTRKIQQIQVSSDNKKMAFKDGIAVFIYNFDDKTEIKLPIMMEGFRWVRNQNTLEYTHTNTKVGETKKHYLLSQLDLEKMESKPIINKEFLPYIGGFKVSPDKNKVIIGSNLSGRSNVWHYDIAKDRLTVIPSESGIGQFKWVDNDEFIIIGNRGIMLFQF